MRNAFCALQSGLLQGGIRESTFLRSPPRRNVLGKSGSLIGPAKMNSDPGEGLDNWILWRVSSFRTFPYCTYSLRCRITPRPDVLV